jgi:Zn-dependent protease
MVDFLFPLAILLLSVVTHEVSHGLMANYLGDPTAKYAGRLSLNPLRHLDPIGSVLVPGFLILTGLPVFGWAKPVPINPYNFRDQKYGSAKVAIAGSGANLFLATIFGFFSRLLPLEETIKAGITTAFFERQTEVLSDLLQTSFIAPIFLIFSLIVFTNILLAIFNLIPIPPLDGSHILFTFLPYSMEHLKITLSQYGFFILILFIFLGGFRILSPIISGLYFLITGQHFVL